MVTDAIVMELDTRDFYVKKVSSRYCFHGSKVASWKVCAGLFVMLTTAEGMFSSYGEASLSMAWDCKYHGEMNRS